MCRSLFYFLMIPFDLAPGQDIFGCAYLDPSFNSLFAHDDFLHSTITNLKCLCFVSFMVA